MQKREVRNSEFRFFRNWRGEHCSEPGASGDRARSASGAAAIPPSEPAPQPGNASSRCSLSGSQRRAGAIRRGSTATRCARGKLASTRRVPGRLRRLLRKARSGGRPRRRSPPRGASVSRTLGSRRSSCGASGRGRTAPRPRGPDRACGTGRHESGPRRALAPVFRRSARRGPRCGGLDRFRNAGAVARRRPD